MTIGGESHDPRRQSPIAIATESAADRRGSQFDRPPPRDAEVSPRALSTAPPANSTEKVFATTLRILLITIFLRLFQRRGLPPAFPAWKAHPLMGIRRERFEEVNACVASNRVARRSLAAQMTTWDQTSQPTGEPSCQYLKSRSRRHKQMWHGQSPQPPALPGRGGGQAARALRLQPACLKAINAWLRNVRSSASSFSLRRMPSWRGMSA